MSDDFGLRGPKLPWACPNDRQLALRAKLQTGWSIKTNQFSQYPKPPPLTEREQQIIVSVVKKAEELDLNEQHRVGKLVDRLESLKKLANGNGVTECVLCGDTFGFYVFGRSNYKCHDCQKAVCRKCVVELSAAKAGIVTASSSTSSGKDTIIRLCKVCSENRELIKKSGAWFFRGVPKYILPEKKNHYTNTYEKYAASPRYQEQKYVSRYIHASDEPSSSTNSGSSSSGGAASSSAAVSSSSGATGASSLASTTASSSTTATSATTITGTTSSSTSSGNSSSNNNTSSSRPVGFFWSRSLQSRSASSSQPSSVVDQDNESSSGDELCGASSSHLLRSSAVAAASVAGGAAVTGSSTTTRNIFGSRKGKSGLTTNEGAATSTNSSNATTSSNHNGGGLGGGGSNSSGGGWSGISLSRGNSPPASRFLLQRNTPASSSLRSNVGSPVPPGTSPIPSSATTTSNTPNEHEQFSTCEQATPGPSGMTEYSYVSSSHDLSASSSFRKKSYERIDFSLSREVILKSDSQQHGGAAAINTGGSTANNSDNNPKSSSSNDGLYQPGGSSSTMATATTQSMYNSTPSVASSTASAASGNSQQHQGQTSSSTLSSPLGIIQVALLYDDSHQALHCSVLHAKDLTPTDINGLADPYCILKLIPSRFEGTHLRTKTIHKSVNPIFNETLTFYGVTLHDLTWQTLQILVMDDDRWGKDCLGTAQIPLHRIRSQQTRCFAQPLERGRLSEEREWGRGRLLLSLTYMTEKSLLLVGVIQAQDLPALDHNGTSDPFAKVRLLHDTNLGALSTSCFSSSSINRKYRTSVKWRTLNPIFQEEFSLKVSIVDLPRLALVISVWDKDLGKNDDYIGGVVLSTGSKGERLQHWLNAIKLPNTKHFKWHTLSPSVLPSH